MKFTLALALHNHQPVGNFSAVFEEAHTKCYLPFLELIKDYPQIKFSLHQSGILWDWQKQHHPEFFELVGNMVDSGQVELLSGGFLRTDPAFHSRTRCHRADQNAVILPGQTFRIAADGDVAGRTGMGTASGSHYQ